MRKALLAAGLALAAAVALSSTPSNALSLAAPIALKDAAAGIDIAAKTNCWGDCGYYGYRPYYRPYYRRYYGYYRPYYRPYYRRPYYGYYRPYYRPYYSHYRPYYGYGYGRPWWLSGPYYGPPRPRFYIGSSVYWY